MLWIILSILLIFVLVSVYCCCRINYFDEDIDFEMVYYCDKLFIVKHFKCLKDVNIIDTSNFMKDKSIIVNQYLTRAPEENEVSGRTEYFGPAALYKLKNGGIVWQRL